MLHASRPTLGFVGIPLAVPCPVPFFECPNVVAKTTKDQDVKYKTKEAAGLDKGSAELKGDFGGVSDELAAVQQYDKELQGRCTKKVPSYEEIAKAREAEIAGLKEALTTLEGGAMFLQENSVSHR